MNQLEKLKAAFEASTPDWVAVSPNDSANVNETHIEIHDGYGRTATVYGEPDDAEVIANTEFIALAHNLMPKLLKATELCALLAELKTDEEMGGNMSGDDAVTTLGEFIASARDVMEELK